MTYLESRAVGVATSAQYQKELTDFMNYAQPRGLDLKNAEEVDHTLTAYLNKMFAEGHQSYKGDRLLAAFLHHHPEYGRNGSLKLPHCSALGVVEGQDFLAGPTSGRSDSLLVAAPIPRGNRAVNQDRRIRHLPADRQSMAEGLDWHHPGCAEKRTSRRSAVGLRVLRLQQAHQGHCPCFSGQFDPLPDSAQWPLNRQGKELQEPAGGTEEGAMESPKERDEVRKECQTGPGVGVNPPKASGTRPRRGFKGLHGHWVPCQGVGHQTWHTTRPYQPASGQKIGKGDQEREGFSVYARSSLQKFFSCKRSN